MRDTPFVEHIIRGSWKDKRRDEISSSAYVVDTLEAALWCVGTTSSFEAALVRAVNLGECADGVGAVTGQLAGAIYGAGAIPLDWYEALAWREYILEQTDIVFEESWPRKGRPR